MDLQYRLIHFIQAIWRQDGQQFIAELFRQLLNREPGAIEYQHYMRLLTSRQTKLSIIEQIMCSEEAEQNYLRPPTSFIPTEATTAASLIRRFYAAEPFFFVHSLYDELLCRNPDSLGLQGHLKGLMAKHSKKLMLRQFLNSIEFQHLLVHPQLPLKSEPNPYSILTASPRTVQHIGIFLAYPHPLAMDGEGIGRFLYRLTRGMLSNFPHVHIHIAATGYNHADAEQSFSPLKPMFPGRIHIHHSNNVEHFNTNVPAEIWIVPIISLDLAMFLKKPYILCLHDLVHHQFKDLYFSTYPEFCHRVDRNGYYILHKAAAVVSNSNYVRTHHAIGIAGLPAHKTHVIRLAPPSDEYQTFSFMDQQHFRAKYQLHHEYIVFPTVLRLHKNFERLLAAFIQFRLTIDGYHSRLRLVFTDQLSSSPKEADVMRMLHHVQDPEIVNSLMFIGRIPTSDLPSLYKYAVGTIVPTLFEGSCPFPILESLTVGTPVAAANLEVTNEIIPDMSAFLAFNPYSVDEIEASLRALWAFRHTLVPRQQEVTRGAMQRGWSDVANEYYALLQHVILNPV